jgi:hypothetical protein
VLVDRCDRDRPQHKAVVVYEGQRFFALLVCMAGVANTVAPFFPTVLAPSPWRTEVSSCLGAWRGRTDAAKRAGIHAIFGPAMLPFVHVRVMSFVPVGSELLPLDTGMEDRQNVVENFVEGALRFWPCLGSFQMRGHITVDILTGDPLRNPIVEPRYCGGIGGGIHGEMVALRLDVCVIIVGRFLQYNKVVLSIIHYEFYIPRP